MDEFVLLIEVGVFQKWEGSLGTSLKTEGNGVFRKENVCEQSNHASNI